MVSFSLIIIPVLGVLSTISWKYCYDFFEKKEGEIGRKLDRKLNDKFEDYFTERDNRKEPPIGKFYSEMSDFFSPYEQILDGKSSFRSNIYMTVILCVSSILYDILIDLIQDPSFKIISKGAILSILGFVGISYLGNMFEMIDLRNKIEKFLRIN